MKFLNNLDLQKNEIQNFRVQNLPAAPSNPVQGQHYFDTALKTEFVYVDGIGWVDSLAQGNYKFTGSFVVDGNNVSLKEATEDTLGGVKLASKLDITNGTNNVVPAYLLNNTLADYLKADQKGVPNGLATLDADGVIPANQLPSFVDDVVELVKVGIEPETLENGQLYYNKEQNVIYTAIDGIWTDPQAPQTGKIYVSLEDNNSYRFGGTTLVQIGADKLLSYTEDIIGDDTTTRFTIEHGLATRNVVVEVYEKQEPYEKVYVQVLHNTNNITIAFSQAPAVGTDYKVLIIAVG